jgi:hypothetical protein
MAILYKYLPLTCDLHLDRIIRLLDGWIYFASPIHFNDPFEMSPVITGPEYSQLVQIVERLDTESLLSKNAKRRIHDSVSKSLLNGGLHEVSKDWIQSIGVLCLTENPKDLLMWAHYASNHSGICVGFETSTPPFGSARSVNYSNQREHVSIVSHSSEDEELIQKVLLTKSSHWRYEKEWRAIKRPIREEERAYYKTLIESDPSEIENVAEILVSEGGPGIYQFDKVAIRRIYFGARIDKTFKDRIEQEANTQSIMAKRFQLELDRKFYWLNEVKT